VQVKDILEFQKYNQIYTHHSLHLKQSTRDSYFRNKVNTFNIDAPLNILKKQRQELMDKIAPYQELGRGVAGLTRKQQQELARVNYEIGQLEKSGMGKLINQGWLMKLLQDL
jgi:hypothetical protein